MGSRILRTASLALLLLVSPNVTRAQPALGKALSTPPPSDALLRLVPPDAAVVVSVENLREHASNFLKSPLAADLRQLPAVRAWFASEKYQQFERSRAQIEALLGANLTDLRDELLGDAVVLALRLPADGPADASQARGILLVKVRDLALLKRLIRVINTTQQESGELAAVADRQRNGTTYHVREFPPAADRLAEWFVAFPDGTFAFSNSEAMIQSVIDRKAPARVGNDAAEAVSKIDPGLGELPKLMAVQSKLPGPAAARLFVDPRQFERLIAAQPRPDKPADARPIVLLERYLAAVEYAGAALTWSDESIVIHSVETLNASLLDPWLRHWAGDTRPIDSSISLVPPTALAHVTGRLDASAMLDALSQFIGDQEQPRLTNFETLASCLLLGQDLRTHVFPRLGPGVLAYFDTPPTTDEPAAVSGSKTAPPTGWPFPLVVVVSLGADAEPGTSVTLAAAADNALRAVLAVMAVDDKRYQGRSRIVNRTVAGTTITTLDPSIPFAYAVDRVHHRLVVSQSPGAVERYLESPSDPRAGERLRRIHAAARATSRPTRVSTSML